jgi:hypothetical protein
MPGSQQLWGGHGLGLNCVHRHTLRQCLIDVMHCIFRGIMMRWLGAVLSGGGLAVRFCWCRVHHSDALCVTPASTYYHQSVTHGKSGTEAPGQTHPIACSINSMCLLQCGSSASELPGCSKAITGTRGQF